MTLSAFQKDIADSSVPEPQPKPLWLYLISEESPLKGYSPEKQKELDADWNAYRKERLTEKEYELPVINIQAESRDYEIGGFLLFQNDEARQLRLWVQFPDESLNWQTATTKQEYDQNKLCQQILETHLGTPHFAKSLMTQNYQFRSYQYLYSWGKVELVDAVGDYEDGSIWAIHFSFGDDLVGSYFDRLPST